jgi:hypothetical protein
VLTINSDSYRRLVFFEQPISELSKDKRLSHPKILGDLPLKRNVGSFPLRVNFTDDGSIKESAIWLDGEKVAWQTLKDTLSKKVNLDAGSHEVLIQVKDDQDLVSSRKYYIWVEE